LKTPPAILDDAPKTEPEEDRLGYKGFARRLATALSAMRPENGYVIGLQGPWGSGKSTVLNFVKAYLARGDKEDELVLVDFSPWLISGHQDLIAGFFKIFTEAVNPALVQKETGQQRAKRIASTLADPVFRSAGEVATALNPEWGAWATPAANVAGKAVEKALAGWASEPSLQTVYDRLRRALLKDRRRFVIFIDDLDRLKPREIRAIAQMVKSVGGLPHVTYVLAYDRAIVWPALDGASGRAGKPSFAEKIIQHEVSLPAPSRPALMKLLGERTSFLVGDIWDRDRWADILRNGVNRWLKSARDVARLSNALAFAGPALAGELDPQDLFAMEGLRLFDQVAFTWVREQRDYLIGDGRYILMREEEKAAMIARLHATLSEASKTEVIGLLCTLFPTRSKELAANDLPVLGARGERQPDVAVRRGMATADGFDAYFSLSLPEGRVSNLDVDAVIAALNDRAAIGDLLAMYIARLDETGASLIASFLEQVRFRFEVEGAPPPTLALVSALLAAGDEIIRLDDDLNSFGLHPFRYFLDLLNSLLDRAGPQTAGDLLRSAMGDGVPPATAADVLFDRGRELGVFPTGGLRARPRVTEKAFNELGPEVMAIILKAKDNGSLEDAPRYANIMSVWAQFGDAVEAREWLRGVATRSAVNFAKIALHLLSWSVNRDSQGYLLERQPQDDYFSLEELGELSAKHRGHDDLSDDQRARLSALNEGVERILSEAGEDEGGGAP
jgi:predicted KAP-like P-loop ATPase